jgi:outer membrane protein
MKKIVTIALVAAGLVLGASAQTKAQGKIGYISINEIIAAMPEAKKADSSLVEFQNALAQNFDDQKREFNEADSLLNSKDTAKYTKAQLEIKRKNLGEIYLKLNGYQQQASQQLQQKQQELVAPIQKKAVDAVQAVAKENGYAYVLTKDALLAYPIADDLLPLVKKKLGLK